MINRNSCTNEIESSGRAVEVWYIGLYKMYCDSRTNSKLQLHVRSMPDFEAGYFTEEIKRDVSNLSNVAWSVPDRNSRYNHVCITYCLDLKQEVTSHDRKWHHMTGSDITWQEVRCTMWHAMTWHDMTGVLSFHGNLKGLEPDLYSWSICICLLSK